MLPLIVSKWANTQQPFAAGKLFGGALVSSMSIFSEQHSFLGLAVNFVIYLAIGSRLARSMQHFKRSRGFKI